MNSDAVVEICSRIDALILEFITDAKQAAPARYEALVTAASLLTQAVDRLVASSPGRRETSTSAFH